MKAKTKLKLCALALLVGAQTLFAQLNVPSDGSDGVLNITSNTVIDLSQASYGTWDQNNSTNSGNGVYDPSKWAVVFKYQSVNIATNCTVSFLNHPAHAPVVWLVQSNAIITGTINLTGASPGSGYPAYLFATEPGPGGFRGGTYGPLGEGAGYGPGGVNGGNANAFHQAADYVGYYGNPQILPLIGGSGGGGIGRDGGHSGPPGGGALLIVSSGTCAINGTIISGGQNNNRCCDVEWSASTGGAIRIIADSILGSGSVSAARTRVEANSISQQLNITPNTVAVAPGIIPTIWPPDLSPSVGIFSVNGQSSPADPHAGLLTSSDNNISTNGPVDILLQSQNFPPSGSVTVRVVPKYGNLFNVTANFVSGTFSNALWKATTTLPNGFCVLQAHATSP